MPTVTVVHCGFSEVLAHLKANNIIELRQYNDETGTFYPRMRVEEVLWQKSRKRYISAIKDK